MVVINMMPFAISSSMDSTIDLFAGYFLRVNVERSATTQSCNMSLPLLKLIFLGVSTYFVFSLLSAMLASMLGVLGYLLLLLLGPYLLLLLGFGRGGVIAHSIAASIQSMLGNVAAGSLFAMAQSIAAKGPKK